MTSVLVIGGLSSDSPPCASSASQLELGFTQCLLSRRPRAETARCFKVQTEKWLTIAFTAFYWSKQITNHPIFPPPPGLHVSSTRKCKIPLWDLNRPTLPEEWHITRENLKMKMERDLKKKKIVWQTSSQHKTQSIITGIPNLWFTECNHSNKTSITSPLKG